MSIVEGQKVKVKWNKRNTEHYESKGYKFTKTSEVFEIDVEDLKESSNIKVKFICDYCNGENQKSENSKWKNFNEILRQRKITIKDCCSNKNCIAKKKTESFSKTAIPREKSLAAKFPELIKEWSAKNIKSPYAVTYGSKKNFWWICNKGHEWETTVNTRTNTKTGCPYCAGQKVCLDNCLATNHPEIASEWHPTKNETLTPYDVVDGSVKKVWWIGKCGHEWDTTISSRTRNNSNCPYCSGQKVSMENCLETNHPQMSKEWHPTKNGDLTPRTISKSSGKKVWWQCENRHEWNESPNTRLIKKNGCPYCSKHKVTEDYCFSTMFPELTKEWHPINEISPKEITPYSTKKVWWKCSTCKHKWRTIVKDRSNGRGCPQCNESKGEKKIREFLITNNIPFKSQFEFNDLKGINEGLLKFDFAILDESSNLKILLEYDGEFHFEKQYDNDGYERTLEHDKRKNEYCENNKIPLLRIPYWEFDNIEEMLTIELIKIK